MIFKIINSDTLQIEHSYEAEEKLKYGGPWGTFPHISVPEGLDPDCVKAESHQETVTVVDVPESLDEQGNTVPAVTHDEQITVYTLVEDAGKVAEKELKTKEALVTASYNKMNEDIYEDMYNVYGTKNSDSAVAWQETFKNMKSSPALFSVLGLKAEKAVGSFSVGDALDDDAKIVSYAGAMLGSVTQYAIRRLQRIAQFKEERNAILNG